MRQKLHKIMNLVLLSVMLGVSCSSQQRDSVHYDYAVEQAFVKARTFYERGVYDSSALVLTQLLKQYPRNHRATAAYIMGAKAYYHLNEYRTSIQLLKDLFDLYPQSLYCAEGYYTLGLNYIQLRRYDDAARALIQAIERTSSHKIQDYSTKALEFLCNEKLRFDELEVLEHETNHDFTRSCVRYYLAEKTYRNGNVLGAQRLLESILELPRKNKYVPQAISFLEAIRKRGLVKIGVVLPLMLKSERPSLREIGVEFLEGIQCAIEEYNRNALVHVTLELRDSERDPTVAARHVADLTADEAVSVIIGPISSNEVIASVGIANERGVPLITPTATANGITTIGPYIFQANPDYEVRGRIAAYYASTTLQAKRFAVLAPNDNIGKQLVDGFLAEVKKQGGTIVAQQWYAPNADDVRNELESIRRTAMALQETTYIDFSMKMKRSQIESLQKLVVSHALLDSVLERQRAVPVELLLGPRGKYLADSLGLPVAVAVPKYDSLQYPVTTIDAIFIPITNSDEIPIISSQLKYYNIQTQILGTGDWYDINELDQNRQYTDGVIFFVDSYIDMTSPQYLEFVNRYKQSMKGKVPTTNTIIAYDVTSMVLQTFLEGSTRRADVAVSLARRTYDGIHSRIVFSKNRVNCAMNILQYKNRSLQHYGVVQLPE
ncbi:MAG: penicillin-binding protein activator [Bacteroidetes bacterium]|nr:penicillin-binding protein activator [Bacteroidota bacterium]